MPPNPTFAVDNTGVVFVDLADVDVDFVDVDFVDAVVVDFVEALVDFDDDEEDEAFVLFGVAVRLVVLEDFDLAVVVGNSPATTCNSSTAGAEPNPDKSLGYDLLVSDPMARAWIFESLLPKMVVDGKLAIVG